VPGRSATDDRIYADRWRGIKDVDLVGFDAREDGHQPQQPEELNSANNSDTMIACSLILFEVPIAIMPRPQILHGPIAGVMTEGAEMADQRVKMTVGVKHVHDGLAPLVDKGLAHGEARMRVVIMERANGGSDLVVADWHHFDDTHTTNKFGNAQEQRHGNGLLGIGLEGARKGAGGTDGC
jgi:hypothetical protein